MSLLRRCLDLKSRSPLNYWVRVFLAAYVVLNFTMFGLVNADAPVGDVTDNELIADSQEVSLNNYVPSVPGMRQSNGTLWHFGTNVVTYNSDHEIVASYSSDNGSSWSTFVVMDNSHPGFEVGGTPWKVTDAVGLSNNSVVISVVLHYFDTDNNNECWLLCHWNNSDLSQWELIDVYSITGQNVDTDPTIAVNDTDTVMVTFEIDNINQIHYDFFYPDTRTIDLNTEPNIEPQANFGPWALCNTSGVFFIAYILDGDDDLDVVTTDGDWTLVFTQSYSTNFFAMDIVITGDDTFVFIVSQHAGGYLELYYWNETSNGVRFLIDNPTGDTTISYPKLMTYNDTDTFIIVMGYSTNDDGFKYAGGNYYIDSAVWELRWSSTVWDESDDTAKDYTTYLPRDLFPQTIDPVTGVLNHTMLPNSGWYAHITDYTVIPDEEDLHEIHSDTTTWPGAPYYHYNPFYGPPDVPDDDEDEDEPICATSWIMFAVIAVMIIVIIGWSADTML